MSKTGEPKRVALTTISQTTSSVFSGSMSNDLSAGTTIPRFGADFLTPDVPEKNAGAGSGKNANKTIRLNLELFESDTNKYPEFSYAKLIHIEKKKQKKLKQVTNSNGFSDPFAENDDDVARIAKELEQKYGSSYGSGRGRSKKDDLCDIGMGYDESDSFIDNTEAYDEVIPEEVETIEGGFYINCGALEFKNLAKKSGTTRTDEIIKMPERPRKRILSTSSEESSSSEAEAEAEEDDEAEEDADDDDDDDEDVEDDESESESETENTDSNLNVKKIKNHTSKKFKHAKKRVKTSLTSSKKSSSSSVSSINKKLNKKSNVLTSCSSSNSPRPHNVETNSDVDERARQKIVKTTTVKDMLKAKRDSFLKSQGATIDGAAKNTNGEVKCPSSDGDSSSETEETESAPEQDVVQEKMKKTNADGTEKLRANDTKLPQLDSDVLTNINNFKEMARSKNITDKKFIFDQNLTDLLLHVDDALLCIDKNERNMVFAHMEYSLQLPKYFFLRKSKQLRIKEEKNKTNRALDKLRKAVIELMPTVIVTYETELCKYADMQSGTLNSDQPPKMPRKKFPWNNHIRNLLYDVYQVRWTSYAVLGTRKDSLEDFINNYMRDKVVEIWPNGWMRYEELQKEIEKRKNASKKTKDKAKQKEIKTMLMNTATIVTPQSTAITSNPPTIEALPNVTNSYLKQFEEFATSSSRSLANSDTDSVASASSNSLKRKTASSNKQKNNKLHKQSISAHPLTDTTQPIASTSAQAAAAALAAQNTALDLILSPSKKTDHSIQNIITAIATSVAAATPPPGGQNTTVTKPTLQSNAHSSIPSARPPAHVINLDDYKCPSDILQTSKQLAAATIPTPLPLSSNSTVKQLATNQWTTNSKNTQLRSESGSESDSVEIVGVYPAVKSSVLPSQLLSAAPHKKSNKKVSGSSGGNFVTSNTTSSFNMEQLYTINNNTTTFSDPGANAQVLKALKHIEKLQNQRFVFPQANIKGGAPLNQ